MVNTFVVSSCLIECAKQLDYRRLGKQRVEARQLYYALTGKYDKAWVNHPATLAWVGYENALNHYTNAMITEWIARGYKNTMEMLPVTHPVEWPWWWNWDVLHNSHKASLNRKDPQYYSFDVPPEYAKFGYVWPSKVPEQYRNAKNPPLEIVCAEIQKPVNYSKQKKRKPAESELEPASVVIVKKDIAIKMDNSKPKSNPKRKSKSEKGQESTTEEVLADVTTVSASSDGRFRKKAKLIPIQNATDPDRRKLRSATMGNRKAR